MATRGVARDHDAFGIYLVSGSVGAQPANRTFDVMHGGRERGLSSQTVSSELLISEFSFFKFCVVFPDTTYAYSVFADFGQRVQLGK